MAKRKSGGKNMLKAVLDFVILALAGSIFGFLALPFAKASISGSGYGAELGSFNGYDLLDFEANAGVATCILLLIIFASALALFALLKFLGDAGLVKSSTFNKVCNLLTVVMALAVLVMTIVVMIVVPANCKTNGAFGISGGTTAVWYSLIINACVGLASFVVSVFSIRK